MLHIYLMFAFFSFDSSGITEGFSMCAGDFVEVYNEESQECKMTWFPYKLIKMS